MGVLTLNRLQDQSVREQRREQIRDVHVATRFAAEPVGDKIVTNGRHRVSGVFDR